MSILLGQAGLSIAEDLSMPNPFTIMGGAANLIGWWPLSAAQVISGNVAAILDQSGNDAHMSQGNSNKRVAFNAAHISNGRPAMVPAGVSNRGVSCGSLNIQIGDFACWFVVCARSAGCPALAIPFIVFTSDFVGIGFDGPTNRTSTGFFGYQITTYGGVGGKNTIHALDTDINHYFGFYPNPATGFWNSEVDGVLGVDTVNNTGATKECNFVSSSSDCIGPLKATNPGWSGPIFDSWITKAPPSPTQLLALRAYSVARYGTP